MLLQVSDMLKRVQFFQLKQSKVLISTSEWRVPMTRWHFVHHETYYRIYPYLFTSKAEDYFWNELTKAYCEENMHFQLLQFLMFWFSTKISSNSSYHITLDQQFNNFMYVCLPGYIKTSFAIEMSDLVVRVHQFFLDWQSI